MLDKILTSDKACTLTESGMPCSADTTVKQNAPVLCSTFSHHHPHQQPLQHKKVATEHTDMSADTQDSCPGTSCVPVPGKMNGVCAVTAKAASKLALASSMCDAEAVKKKTYPKPTHACQPGMVCHRLTAVPACWLPARHWLYLNACFSAS